jgi:hypothetical protein
MAYYRAVARVWSLRSIQLRPVLLLGMIGVAEYILPWRQVGRTVTLVGALVLTVGFVRQSLQHVRLAARVESVIKTRFLELGLTAVALVLLASKASVWARELADPATRSVLDGVYR